MLLHTSLTHVLHGNSVEEFPVWKTVNKGLGGREEKLKNFSRAQEIYAVVRSDNQISKPLKNINSTNF